MKSLKRASIIIIIAAPLLYVALLQIYLWPLKEDELPKIGSSFNYWIEPSINDLPTLYHANQMPYRNIRVSETTYAIFVFQNDDKDWIVDSIKTCDPKFSEIKDIKLGKTTYEEIKETYNNQTLLGQRLPNEWYALHQDNQIVKCLYKQKKSGHSNKRPDIKL